jgi:O-antigen ligase/polysaccharide polymerase Wzy-like membrane protein
MTIAPENRILLLIKLLFSSLLILCLLLSIFFLQKDNFVIGIILLATPFVLVLLTLIITKPIFSFAALFFANYFAMGIARYIKGPLGLSIDILLVLTWIALFFSQFNNKVEWKKAWNSLTVAAIVWFAYALFQLFNPEIVSRVAWFYAMRAVSLYFVLTVPLTFILLDDKKYLDKFLNLWAWFTVIGVLKGTMQYIIGPDPWEQYWLDTIGGKTHLLSQGLRVFSFFTDSATYGGSMGFSGVVFSIVALTTKVPKKKIFYIIIALIAFYGMLISGTRGAIAVPFAGFAVYAVLSKKFKLIIIGGFLIISVYLFLRFTTIGESVYIIRRFRGGLDPNNASLLVRKENQKLIGEYLSSRPFGGGIGSAGNWGLRFTPSTFLAKTPTDSWYVQIWAEQGIVGITLHLGILIFILLKSSFIIMFRLKEPELKGKAMALCSGMFGVMAASYGSSALGQLPNGLIVYISMAFIFMMPKWVQDDNRKNR